MCDLREHAQGAQPLQPAKAQYAFGGLDALSATMAQTYAPQPSTAAYAPQSPAAQYAEQQDVSVLKMANAARAAEINSAASLDKTLLDESDTLVADLTYQFGWSGSEDAPTFHADITQLSQAFAKNGIDIDLSKPQYVHSIEIKSSWSSFKVPLMLTLGGIRDANVEHLVKLGGSGQADSYTHIVPPGQSYGESATVHTLTGVSMKMLKDHGGADIDTDAKTAIVPIPGTNNVAIAPMSHVGRVLAANGEQLTGNKAGLQLVDPVTMPVYSADWQKVRTVLAEYHSKILSKLPSTKLAGHTASLKRFDQGAEALGDVSNAAGFSDNEKAAVMAKKQLVLVQARIRLIDPAKLTK